MRFLNENFFSNTLSTVSERSWCALHFDKGFELNEKIALDKKETSTNEALKRNISLRSLSYDQWKFHKTSHQEEILTARCNYCDNFFCLWSIQF